MELTNKIEICKIVARAILADTRITDSECEFLNKLMNRYNIGEDDRQTILSCNVDDDLTSLIMNLTDDDARNELLVELALAVAVDGEISSSERVLLSRVAKTLNISEEDLNLMLEAAIS